MLLAVHQPPEVRRHPVVQRRAVRPVRGRASVRPRAPPRRAPASLQAPAQAAAPVQREPAPPQSVSRRAAMSTDRLRRARPPGRGPARPRSPPPRSTARHARRVLDHAAAPTVRSRPAGRDDEPVVITGAALGLPGHRAGLRRRERRADPGRRAVHRRHPAPDYAARCSTSTSPGWSRATSGDPVFETIESRGDVIKLAGRYGSFDSVEEFGVDTDRDAALDAVTQAGDRRRHRRAARRGHPAACALPHHHARAPSCPGRWGLPDELRDDTGVIFASAFPGMESFADDLNRYHEDRARAP